MRYFTIELPPQSHLNLTPSASGNILTILAYRICPMFALIYAIRIHAKIKVLVILKPYEYDY
jgi:hypothetical protein